METSKCQLKKQDLPPGSCLVKVDGKKQPACQATLRYENGDIYRLITSVHLSRPENYLSNGYGLTPQNLDRLQAAGVDAFWLDIKAHDAEKHKWLTGCSNAHILRLPEEILKRGFTLEVLSLYIPNLVESDELERIARVLSEVDPAIPFTILAFFPEHQMKDFRRPNTKEMVEAYKKVQSTGLQNIKLGNLGVFIHNDEDRDYLLANIDTGAL